MNVPVARWRTPKLVAIAAGALAMPIGAIAAAAPPRPGYSPHTLDPSTFRRVDQLHADTDPLRMSLRELSVDLRTSDDFSSVYLIPGRSPHGADDRFARRSGGITAVFPRSIYAASGAGVIPVIPPGTVFYLDGVPAQQPWDLIGQGGMGTAGATPRGGSEADASQRVNSAVDRRMGVPPGSPADRMPDPAAPSDHERLFLGVRTLLEQAADAR